MTWKRLCDLTTLRRKGVIRVDTDDGEYLVALIGERVYVADAWCTHQKSDLSLGITEGTRIKCPLHQAVFELTDGSVVEGPSGEPPDSIRPLRTYRAKTEGDDVYADL
ncbi:MAG: Rieske (2Fe-2S) protein [Thaumarchaeota archaeon]|nr:Rieske (2Fe-2S) protein [Candidatus Calditenuaceae archaeon]MDW8042057.1 Rieske (2Fe-2S) protein [Nitrososphaerota archaeon]